MFCIKNEENCRSERSQTQWLTSSGPNKTPNESQFRRISSNLITFLCYDIFLIYWSAIRLWYTQSPPIVGPTLRPKLMPVSVMPVRVRWGKPSRNQSTILCRSILSATKRVRQKLFNQLEKSSAKSVLFFWWRQTHSRLQLYWFVFTKISQKFVRTKYFRSEFAFAILVSSFI